MKTHEELLEKYKDRNLIEELSWAANYTRSGYMSKEYEDYYSWLALAAYNRIKELLPGYEGEQAPDETLCEIRVIMDIPDQDFGVIRSVDDDNVELEPKHGTVALVIGACPEDPEALMPIGILDGEEGGRVAFWEPFSAYNELWQKMLAMKKKEVADGE